MNSEQPVKEKELIIGDHEPSPHAYESAEELTGDVVQVEMETPVVQAATTMSPEKHHNQNDQVSVRVQTESQVASASIETPATLEEKIAAVSSVPVTAKRSRSKKKRFVLMGGAGLIVAGVVAAWMMFLQPAVDTPAPVVQQAPAEPVPVKKMGAVVTVADGVVTFLHGDGDWRSVTDDTQLVEGDRVRTGLDSRAVLMLDDGSAVRLDAFTTVTLASMATDDIVIEQENGFVYSRVVESDRRYSVKVGATAYQALGTAFGTVNTTEMRGVQVYESAVKAVDVSVEVDEGEQYYSLHEAAELQNKVTSIDVAKLVDNEFLAWNMTEDEKVAAFQTKMGILPEVKKKSEEKSAAEKKKQEEKKVAAEKAKREAEEKKKEATNKEKIDTSGEKVTRGKLTLKLVGKTLQWSYGGKAAHGFKVVHSSKNKQPVLHEDSAIYVNAPNVGSLAVPKELQNGDRHYMRVCAYTNNTEQEACVDYSNVVEVVLK